MCASSPRQTDLICTQAAGGRKGFYAEGAARAGRGQLGGAAGVEAWHKGWGARPAPARALQVRQHNQGFTYTETPFVSGFAIRLHFKPLLHESLFLPLNPHWKSYFSLSFLFKFHTIKLI